MHYSIRELTIGTILDESILLLRNHFKIFAGVVCIALVPLNLATEILAAYKFPHPPINQTPEETERYLREYVGSLGWVALALILLSLIFLIVRPLTVAAITRAAACEYLGKPTTIRESYTETLRACWPVLLTALLTNAVVALAFIGTMIPAIIILVFALPPFFAGMFGTLAAFGVALYLSFKFSFSVPIVIIEEVGYGKALKRSGELMSDNMSVAVVLSLLLFILFIFFVFSSLIIPVKMLQIFVSIFMQAVLLAYSSVVSVVFYFSARCRHEHFDLYRLSQAVAEDDTKVAA